VDICLVNMPPAEVIRPSLGLSLLKSILIRDGFTTEVVYPNMWFMEYVGYQDFYHVVQTPPSQLALEWLFAQAAFPDNKTNSDSFFATLLDRWDEDERKVLQDSLERIKRLQPLIPGFIDWTAQVILKKAPRIVACTTVFQQHTASLALLRRVKEINPDIITMMGGSNCETVMGKTTHECFPWVDFAVSGEADELISPLCRQILDNGTEIPAADLPEGVYGPVHRKTAYPTITGGDGYPRAVVDSIDGLPFPDYDDFFEELRTNIYRGSIISTLPIETSRGCWWGERSHCTFCGLNGSGMNYRSKSPESVIAEIEHLSDKHNITRFEAVDNILDMKYFETVLPYLEKSEKTFNVFYETKANLKSHHVEQLRRSGIHWIQPGIESLHSKTLKLMGKGCASWQNVQLLKSCRQNGVAVSWAIIANFPGEKDEWHDETAQWVSLISHLPRGSLIGLRFDRYSLYHNNPEAYGLKLTPVEMYNQVYPIPAEKLADLAYFFDSDEEFPIRGHLADRPIPHPNRPGLEKLRQIIQSLRKLDYEPKLLARQNGDILEIEDTRPCALAPLHTIKGDARRVLENCDDAPTTAGLYARLEKEAGFSKQKTDAALDELRSKKLILEIDRRVLSLPLYDPVYKLPEYAKLSLGVLLPPQKEPDTASLIDSAVA